MFIWTAEYMASKVEVGPPLALVRPFFGAASVLRIHSLRRYLDFRRSEYEESERDSAAGERKKRVRSIKGAQRPC